MLEPVSRARTGQTGLSLVELMIALALGLVVVAIALEASAAQLRESRQLLAEARLMQDLRTAADLVARTLRRAGHWNEAATQVGTGAVNPNAEWQLAGDTFAVTHDRGASGRLDAAFRLREGALQMRMGDGHWQALTDTATSQVTAFTLTPDVLSTVLQGACTRPCPPDDTACPPRVETRRVHLQLEAQAARQPAVRRRLETTLSLRNDRVVGACPA